MKNAVVLLLALILSNVASAQNRFEGICRRASATGFSAQHQRALATFREIGLPEKVSVTALKKTGAVYIEAYSPAINPDKSISTAGLYYHSNYVSLGSPHPTKIAFPAGDFMEVFPRILSGQPDGVFGQFILEALASDTTIIVHSNVLRGTIPLNLGTVESFYVTDGRGTYVKIRRSEISGTKRKKYACDIEDPCWDREKGETAEMCKSEETNILVALLNAIIQGAISGLQCSIRGR